MMLTRIQVCSATVAPATLTASVMHNRLIAAGMRGCSQFGIEAFEVCHPRYVIRLLRTSDGDYNIYGVLTVYSLHVFG